MTGDAGAGPSPGEVIAAQQEQILATLRPLLPAGTRVALLDFPNHNNVGDNAIWLGEKTCLAALGVDLVYQCDLASYSQRRLAEQLGPEGVVLLHGGGNFGTVWPAHQAFRERVVGRFRDHRIVQLPQTAYFADEASLKRARDALAGHPALTVLVRDERSRALVGEELGLDARLCPDMAFMIGPRRRPCRPAVDVLWLSRSDHESRGFDAPPTGALRVERVDWLVGEPGRPWSPTVARLTVRVRTAVHGLLRASPAVRRRFGHHVAATFDLLARRRFERGLRILSRGRVVITDRLHGHVLALLLGLPHVVLDNHYGKIADYRRCFTAGATGVEAATDAPGAIAAAERLLAHGAGTAERRATR